MCLISWKRSQGSKTGRIFIAIGRASIHKVDPAAIYFMKENIYSHSNIHLCAGVI
jgi:hypothetical protein